MDTTLPHGMCCRAGDQLSEDATQKAGDKPIAKYLQYGQFYENHEVGRAIYKDFFEPHAWQIPPLNYTGFTMVLSGSAGGGKLLDVDTLIPTPGGFKRMGDMRVGDTVYGDDGMPTTVIAVSDVEIPDRTYEIQFDDGSVVVAGSDHRWLSHMSIPTRGPAHSRCRVPWVVTTEDMRRTLTVSGGRSSHAIPLSPVMGPRLALPVDAYVLGALLGSGDISSGLVSCFCDHDGESVIGEIVRRGYHVTQGAGDQWYVAGVLDSLSMACIRPSQAIPYAYLRASFNQRLELLCGIADTAGQFGSDGIVRLAIRGLLLAEEVRELIASLGMKVTVDVAHDASYRTATADARCTLEFYAPLPVSKLRRNLRRQARHLDAPLQDRHKYRHIISIKPTLDRPMRCIQVDNWSHLYLCSKSFIPTHNSRIAAEKMVAYCLRYPKATCLVLRKKEDANENSTLALLERVVFPSLLAEGRVVRTSKKRRFDFFNGSAILWGGMYGERQRENVRSIGMEGGLDFVWMEEATQFDESDYDEIIARMRGKAAPWRQIVLTTNPGPPEHWIYVRMIVGGEAGVFLSSARDNPSNPDSYIHDLRRLRGVNRLRLAEGIWARAENVVFDSWVDGGFAGLVEGVEQDDIGGSFNVTDEAEYIPGAGDVLWFIDDGYSGEVDEETGRFKARSHPRCFLLVQKRSNGQLVVFGESYAVKRHASDHIDDVIELCATNGWGMPSRVVYDRSAPALGSKLVEKLRPFGVREDSIVSNTVPVSDGNKEVNELLAENESGFRGILVHPRCTNLRMEMPSYSRSAAGTIIKDFDHGPDALRMGVWDTLHGSRVMSEDVAGAGATSGAEAVNVRQTEAHGQKIYEISNGSESVAIVM